VQQLVDDFVTSTSSDYKGFLKAVISGEDAVDALEQFQEGLKDRVLTIFLDFAMKPVEDFFKDVVGGKLIEKLFPPSEAEKQPQKVQTPVEQKLDTANATLNRIEQNTRPGADAAAQALPASSGLMNPSAINIGNLSGGYGGGEISNIFANSGINLENFTQSSEAFNAATESMSISFQDISETSFGYSESLNQNADNIANATKNAAEGGSSFVETLGGVVQGIGMVATSAMGIMAGIEQVQKGGTKNTLAGIGSILMGVGGSILGFGSLFGGKKAANGAVWKGGFQAFADGGIVSGPTLGLVGEGKYNEAIVPLPDGRSIPVQMQGNTIRDKMAGNNNGGSAASPVLSMNFETTTINNVEYVSREQLEMAMMETRRVAARDGARQGANLALDKLQQSPSARKRIGI